MPNTGLCRLDGVGGIGDRRRRGREIVDLVHFELDRVDDVVLDQREIRIGEVVGDVVDPAGGIVVETDDRVPLADQPVAQVGAEKPGASRYESSGLGVRAHLGAPFFSAPPEDG
jgi:hypothetical protein